jgi:hypothetical protein
MHVISVIYSCLQNKKGQEHVKIIIHINLREKKMNKIVDIYLATL